MTHKTYTGVGSRKTPLYILYMMSTIASILEKKGYKLRSGCATGADAAFEDALITPKKNAEIYVPNFGFPYKMGTCFKDHYIIPKERFSKNINDLYYKANRMIQNNMLHKNWENCPPHVMDLHNRNVFQVLGIDLKSKSLFNICYTKNKELEYKDTNQKTGGTGLSINVCSLYKVPVFNLSFDPHYIRMCDFIVENKHLVEFNHINKIKIRSVFNNKKKETHINSFLDFFDTIETQKERRNSLLKRN